MQRDPPPNGDLLALVRMAVNATPAGRALDPGSVALVMAQGGIRGVEVARERAAVAVCRARPQGSRGLGGLRVGGGLALSLIHI